MKPLLLLFLLLLNAKCSSLMQRSSVALRYRTAWRELLHPLSIHARRSTWLNRDQIEINEETLRKPYYHLKPFSNEERQKHARLRQELIIPGTYGPQLGTSTVPEKRFGLRPRHPNSWSTVAPNQLSRHEH